MKSLRFKLPPGPSFILRQLLSVKVVGFFAFTGCIFLVWEGLGIRLPCWAIVLSSVATLPAIIYVQSELQYWKDKRTAQSLGARLAPKVPHRWPAGIDLIVALINVFESGYVSDTVDDWLTEGGQTVDMRSLWTSHIVTTEPQYVKAVLSTHFEEYEKGEVLRAAFRSLFGSGVFNSDGERWKIHRSMTRPFFSRDRVGDFELFDRHADQVVTKMKERFKEGIPVDIQDAFSRYTMDTATEFLFGKDIQSLSGDLPYPSTHKRSSIRTHPSDRFATAFNRAQEQTYFRIAIYDKLWPLVDFWEDTVETNKKILWEFIDPLIENALEKRRVAKGVSEVSRNDGTFLEHLVHQTDDFDAIRDEAFSMLLAGRDSTAAFITFAVTMLADNPNVFARLRNEVLETLSSDGTASHASLREMKYLRAVLNETLRLYPSVPSDTRYSNRGTLLPALDGGKPIYIPPNTEIDYFTWLMHRRTDLWGPTALEFDPDRFLDGRAGKHLAPNSFVFLPFNAGPRTCLGQQYAYNEASAIIAKIAQSFKSITLDMDSNPEAKPPATWKTANGRKAVEKVWVKSHITLHAKGGVWVKMEESDVE